MSDVNAVDDGDDALLLDLLDALVSDRGRTAAARALGVNYRTLVNCWDSRRVSRRMRQALAEFRDAGGVGGDKPGGVGGDEPDVVGDGEAGTETEPLERRVAALEAENRALRELVESQAGQLEELGRRVAALEGRDQRSNENEAVDARDDQERDWRPPRRRPGMPDAGVVTFEGQPDEEHAFGPAAPLVAEWRSMRTAGEAKLGRVDRARASVRRWELETEMLRDFQLTLPPETEPLEDWRRKDHVRWREEALAEARRDLSRAKRMRLLRRLLTLGLSWN